MTGIRMIKGDFSLGRIPGASRFSSKIISSARLFGGSPTFLNDTGRIKPILVT